MEDRRATDRRGEDQALEAAFKAAARAVEAAEDADTDEQAEALIAHGLEGLLGVIR